MKQLAKNNRKLTFFNKNDLLYKSIDIIWYKKS